jgi:hypothetical protein
MFWAKEVPAWCRCVLWHLEMGVLTHAKQGAGTFVADNSSGTVHAKASERELINTRDEKDRFEVQRGASAPTDRDTVADENIRAVAQLQERAADRRTPLECAADRIVAIAGREVSLFT